MKVSLIFFTIWILFFNFVNGYFISQTMAEQIKNSLSNVFKKQNSITGIISAPEFGISHEETIIIDDDNEIFENVDYVDDVQNTQLYTGLLQEPNDKPEYLIGPKPYLGFNTRPYINPKPNLRQRPIDNINNDEYKRDDIIISLGGIENFPRPRPRPKYILENKEGNLRGFVHYNE